MRQLHNILIYFFIVLFVAVFSCEKNQDKKHKDNSIDNMVTEIVSEDTIIKNGNITVTISTDIEKLGQLLDFKKFKPIKVKYQYTFIDNSVQNERISVPGPSDFSLQAILYFDSLTFEKFHELKKQIDYHSSNNKNEFMFDWLDKKISEELKNSNENFHGHADFFFDTINGKSWCLDKKILIQKWSN